MVEILREANKKKMLKEVELSEEDMLFMKENLLTTKDLIPIPVTRETDRQ
ncbi:hypothetical protein [Wolbachia endosymbiont (group B) of Eucosma cana]|nr:hypothetical protein [Wolbachia endosymbiont (group B) of Eucosma cana]